MSINDLKNLDTILNHLDFSSDLYNSLELAIETLHDEHQVICTVSRILNDNLAWVDGCDHVTSDVKDCISMLEKNIKII